VFIQPVAIDGTAEENERIPPEFRIPQWLRLPEGRPTPQFVKRVRELHRGSQLERAGAR